ncbi:hypothetical protein [Phenylobacterium sp.]|uniref:hypothetical protein n=1 Tax=Phenylobacterium sp. TaxID=1871053 RepID=UPI0030F4A289
MNILIRQVHRWVCIAFMLGVIANIVAIFVLKQQTPAFWVGLLALIPLIMLLLTGIYMFVLPYVAKGRRAGR